MIKAKVVTLHRADEYALGITYRTGLNDNLVGREERVYVIRWSPRTRLREFGKDLQRLGKELEEAGKEEL